MELGGTRLRPEVAIVIPGPIWRRTNSSTWPWPPEDPPGAQAEAGHVKSFFLLREYGGSKPWNYRGLGAEFALVKNISTLERPRVLNRVVFSMKYSFVTYKQCDPGQVTLHLQVFEILTEPA